MNDFLKGMNTVGQLFPPQYNYIDYPVQISAWKGVAASFCQAGNSMVFALKEFSNAKQQNKQTP